jgi:hypothetical protein
MLRELAQAPWLEAASRRRRRVRLPEGGSRLAADVAGERERETSRSCARLCRALRAASNRPASGGSLPRGLAGSPPGKLDARTRGAP